ncbi:hypothetical protein Sjap_001748 [Stephania japonica]|uniref:Uncharacterized protein n=1 Tax=Stephania japonica TaxID=461633 RepID=A0AAP0PRT1_9MAGN
MPPALNGSSLVNLPVPQFQSPESCIPPVPSTTFGSPSSSVPERHIIQLCRRSVSILCFKWKLNYKKHTKEMDGTFLQKCHSPKSISKRGKLLFLEHFKLGRRI